MIEGERKQMKSEIQIARARSLAGRRWQRGERRERVRRLAHKFIHPILFKKRSLRKERGKFFRIWLLLITHRRTVWGCCEMGGRGPFLFLFFARAFWRAAAGVKAGPAATTTLLLAIQGLCSSAFFCFFAFFSSWHWPVDSPDARFSMDSQRQNFYQNARKYTTRVSADVSREISHSLQMPVTSSPFPVSRMTFLYFVSFFFEFFFSCSFPAQLMTT